jgi:hypothetical protein
MDREAELREQIAELRAELDDIQTKKLREESESMVGKCYAYRDNSYSNPRPGETWDVFKAVTRVSDDGCPMGIEFEMDCYGEFKMRSGMITRSGCEVIPAAEFWEAWDVVKAAAIESVEKWREV